MPIAISFISQLQKIFGRNFINNQLNFCSRDKKKIMLQSCHQTNV
ncbi:unnamed protein product [Paramecium octaurelia]|uniref:Uncharacterized protein n=1 Tax=Paramecium octaurelia TaxID=43137 RepID=A0A8S1UFE1_PAROT|nr:unnamed protein product [Paramecium octaurelia]